MKHFFVKHKNGNITHSNWPIKETGGESFEFDIKEIDLHDVQDGTKDWQIKNKKISTKVSTRKADQEAAKDREEIKQVELKAEKDALKEKCKAGTATPEEIQQALSKLL